MSLAASASCYRGSVKIKLYEKGLACLSLKARRWQHKLSFSLSCDFRKPSLLNGVFQRNLGWCKWMLAVRLNISVKARGWWLENVFFLIHLTLRYTLTLHKLSIFFDIDVGGSAYEREERGLFCLQFAPLWLQVTRRSEPIPDSWSPVQPKDQRCLHRGIYCPPARHDELRQSNIGGLVVLPSARGDPASFNCHEGQAWTSVQCRGGKSVLCSEVKVEMVVRKNHLLY